MAFSGAIFWGIWNRQEATGMALFAQESLGDGAAGQHLAFSDRQQLHQTTLNM